VKQHVKTLLIGLSVFPMFVLLYMIYIHVISALDPILSLVIGGGFIIAILLSIFWLIVNIKDFVVSIFKDNKEVNEKGFKKHF
jgi:hypothetical protein